VQGAINRSTEVLGTVVGNSYSTTNDGGTESGAYYPVVEFTGSDGQTVRFTDGAGSLPPDYQIGARVPVLYDPESNPPARIRSWKRLWFVPVLLVVIGLLPLAVFLAWQAIALRPAARGSPLRAHNL
jgi:hypothetical protein